MNNTVKFGIAVVAAILIAFTIFSSYSSKISASDQQAIDAINSATQIHENEMEGCKYAADFGKCQADSRKDFDKRMADLNK